MGFIIVLFVVLVGGGWLIGKIVGRVLFPKSDEDFNFTSSKTKEAPTVINNYTTEQHLHISKKDLKELIGKK